MSDWIQTYTGRKFRPLDPSPDDICIEDIAHALSNQCRFTGHVREFYSVAQHCHLVSLFCDPNDAFWGLLHDAAEAYICDLARPVKHDPRMVVYKEAEARIQCAVAQRFGLSPFEPGSVKVADRRLLLTEKRDLLGPMELSVDEKRIWDVQDQAIPYITIKGLMPPDAEIVFLNRFKELTK